MRLVHVLSRLERRDASWSGVTPRRTLKTCASASRSGATTRVNQCERSLGCRCTPVEMDRAAGSLGMGDTAPSSAADEAPTDEVPDTSGSHADVPGAEAMKAPEDPREIPSGEEEVELTQDVCVRGVLSGGTPRPTALTNIGPFCCRYATAFCLANNATPGMYSFWPWENRDMLLVWFYLFFIAFTQIFVLVSLLVLHPPTVDSTTHYVNCHNPSSRVVQLLDQTALWDGWPGDTQTAEAGSCRAEGSCYARLSGTGLARCLALERAFSADVNGSLVHFRILEEETYFYQNIFGSDSYLIMLLQVVCCVWYVSVAQGRALLHARPPVALGAGIWRERACDATRAQRAVPLHIAAG